MFNKLKKNWNDNLKIKEFLIEIGAVIFLCFWIVAFF